MSTLGDRSLTQGTARNIRRCYRAPGGVQWTKKVEAGVSIGDTLAEARRQAGLTVTQVSQRTCIRETIIRGIERGDYSACGGDFYARGHIRSIARAVGADPEPLIREYDQTLGAPRAISAADVFEPATPIKIKERRRPNWSAAMAVVLAVIVGFVVYHVVSSSHAKPSASSSSGALATTHKPAAKHPTHPKPAPTPSPPSLANDVVIRLTAMEDCWVDLTTAGGRQIYSGIVYAGSSMHWTETEAVSLRLGNPGHVSLTVNGKNPIQAGSTEPVTLSLGPGQTTFG
jgi:transcriptional regulator with XRE-family HTH domain